MGGLSHAARERALRVIFEKPVMLGLATRVAAGTLIEIDDPGYRRQRVEFGAPQERPGATEIANKSRISFGPLESDLADPPRFWFVVSDDRNADLLASGELEAQIIDSGSGEMYARAEVAERAKALGDDGEQWRAGLREVWPKFRAGQEPIFPAGALAISIEDTE